MNPEGRIPPQAPQFEEAILGAMLVDSECLTETLALLKAEMFYKNAHKLIFKAIAALFQRGEGVDMLTVKHQLETDGNLEAASGTSYIIMLCQKVSSAANIEYHSKIVIQKYIQRQMIANTAKLLDLAYSDRVDVFDLIDTAYSDLNALSEVSVKPQESLIGELITPQIEHAQKIFRGEIKAGIPSHINYFNNRIGGFKNADLIILAARPGMGKTAFAIQLGMHSARLGYPTAFFSLEMSEAQLTNRIISANANIEGEKLTNIGLSDIEADLAYQALDPIRNSQFIIDDTPSLSIERFKVTAKRLKSVYGIRMIVIDYLQLMKSGNGKNGNREQEISTISRTLKEVAKELDLPIIALSQLSRTVETQGGHKRPMLSHLRESGAIEQDADMVVFLYRPEYYMIDNWDDYQGSDTTGQAEYIVAKHRNGALARNIMGWNGKFTRFYDLDERQTDSDIIGDDGVF